MPTFFHNFSFERSISFVMLDFIATEAAVSTNLHLMQINILYLALEQIAFNMALYNMGKQIFLFRLALSFIRIAEYNQAFVRTRIFLYNVNIHIHMYVHFIHGNLVPHPPPHSTPRHFIDKGFSLQD